MKKSIIFGGSILCLFCLLMIPSISAVEYQIREETIKSSIYENYNNEKILKLKEKLDYDSENIQPSSITGRLLRQLLKLLLIPIWEAVFVLFIFMEICLLGESIYAWHPGQTILQYWLQTSIGAINAIFDFILEDFYAFSSVFPFLVASFMTLPRVIRIPIRNLFLLWFLYLFILWINI